MLGGFRDYVQIPGGGRGNVYAARGTVTSLAAYTATALNGPLLYNPVATRGVDAYVLAMSWAVTTAAAAAGSIGICCGSSTAPTSTGSISLSGNLTPGGPNPQCSIFASGTVGTAATAYLPLGQVHTGALTVDTTDDNTVHLGGLIHLVPGTFAAAAASATLTTGVLDIGIVWVEIAND